MGKSAIATFSKPLTLPKLERIELRCDNQLVIKLGYCPNLSVFKFNGF